MARHSPGQLLTPKGRVSTQGFYEHALDHAASPGGTVQILSNEAYYFIYYSAPER